MGESRRQTTVRRFSVTTDDVPPIRPFTNQYLKDLELMKRRNFPKSELDGIYSRYQIQGGKL